MDLQSILIIAGTITILGVCIHGIYVSRKSSKPQKHWSKDDDLSAPTINLDAADIATEKSVDDDNDFDEFGLSKARTVTTTNEASMHPLTAEENTPSANVAANSGDSDLDNNELPAALNPDIPSVSDITDVVSSSAQNEQESPDDSAPLYASVVSNPKPQAKPLFSSDTITSDTLESGAVNSNEEQAKPRTANQVKAEEELGYTIPELPAEFKASPPTEKLTESGSVTDSDAVQQVTESVDATQPSAPDVPQYLTPEQVAAEAARQTAAEETQKTSIAQAAMNLVTGRKKRTVRKREPVVDANQIGIDFDSIDPVINEAKAMADTQKQRTEPQLKRDIEPEFLAISLKVPKDNPISGAQLLPALITLGMKYGENNIFHRHVNNNGKGPIVFSLANLFKPGVFDVDNMEKESIRGLSLFMTLPTESDAHQVFNMMHNAARKLAEEFNAEILDDSRSTLTKQGLQQYVERIRDFERRRLLG